MENLKKNVNISYSQQDLRRLMKEHKSKSQKAKDSVIKISSPLAKYDHLGKLHCIICRTIIRTESIWKVHVNTKAHKQNLEATRKQKEIILSNSTNKTNLITRVRDSSSESLQKSICERSEDASVNIKQPTSETGITIATIDEAIPEGFFDDPIQDAKARNTEYKDPKDEEWERFKREIKEESYFSNEIIAGEQDEATTDRQIEEIDEQLLKWSKVIELEKKKESVLKVKVKNPDQNIDESSTSDENDSFDEFMNWRSKRLL